MYNSDCTYWNRVNVHIEIEWLYILRYNTNLIMYGHYSTTVTVHIEIEWLYILKYVNDCTYWNMWMTVHIAL